VDWHARYLQQAGWTRDLRRYLFQRTGVRRNTRGGPGTGCAKDLTVLRACTVWILIWRKSVCFNVPKAVLTKAMYINSLFKPKGSTWYLPLFSYLDQKPEKRS
jgi:hypothetical protein